MTVRKRVLYSGRVQGVGFRYTAQRLAADLPIAGYVRNLPNGQVELVAEGEPSDVDRYLAAVAEQMASYIMTADVVEEPPEGLRRFRIRY